MQTLSELAYDIEQLYIDGMSARMIALTLDCPVELVYGWIEGNSVADTPQEEEVYSPYFG